MLLKFNANATPVDPTLAKIASILGQGGAPEPEPEHPGFYFIRHFNGEWHLPGGQQQWFGYDGPGIRNPDDVNFVGFAEDGVTPRYAPAPEDRQYFGNHGVCDGVQNLLEACPELMDPKREFAVFLTPVVKAEQSSEGGWRWHKWGEYIGAHTPTTEYLFDEPLVERVYCYHIYERRPEYLGHPLPGQRARLEA